MVTVLPSITPLPPQPAVYPHDVVPADHLPGWDTAWSQLVTISTGDGPRTLHILDTGPELERLGVTPDATIVAVHGNPTWSYLWRSVAQASIDSANAAVSSGRHTADRQPVWRIIAPDQVDMGFSERLAHPQLPDAGKPRTYRTLEQRIEDLTALTHHLGVLDQARAGHPLFTLGHDWGGVISLGWATLHQDLVTGSISLNTAVHHSPDQPIPAPLQAALSGPLLSGSTVVTDAFLRVTLGLGHPGLSDSVKAGYRAPYRGSHRRGGIGGFVADIPVGPHHRSSAELERISTALTSYTPPVLLLWGARDPVFLDRYQADLIDRIPRIDLHRFERQGHLLAEDVDIASPILAWATEFLTAKPRPTDSFDHEVADTLANRPQYRPLWSFLDEWSTRDTTAIVDMTHQQDGSPARVSWAELAGIIDAMACGLRQIGVRPGDRVSMLVQPGRDLTAALYAVLRVGAIAVVADAGLGIAGMTRAVRTARPDWIIGQRPGLALARAQGWPGRRISVAPLSFAVRQLLGVEHSLHQLAVDHAGQRYQATQTHSDPRPDADAAILFTSGSTGPAKGVRYTHHRLSALTQLLRSAFGVVPGTSLVAGFAPFALLGPAIGATSVTPRMSVTRPSTLTATALAEAAQAGHATMMFASPSALRNVVATAGELTEELRQGLAGITLMLSAGAPVLPHLMDQVLELLPGAEFHSPYGMTESLLLADINHETVHTVMSSSSARGVCVGTAVPGVRIAIAPLLADGSVADELLEGSEATDIFGEVVISAPHMFAGYDRLWITDRRSKQDSTPPGPQWHRTEDVGHLDESGRLWIEGRLQHVVTTAGGPLGPGGPEALIDTLDEIVRSAIVGVGPQGTQATIAVVEPRDRAIAAGLAPSSLATAVRSICPVPLAAVLVTHRVPVDIRHNSKIDRSRLADWADTVLAGGKVGTP